MRQHDTCKDCVKKGVPPAACIRASGRGKLCYNTRLEFLQPNIMEAERINQLNNTLNDLEKRSGEIRVYLDYDGKKDQTLDINITPYDMLSREKSSIDQSGYAAFGQATYTLFDKLDLTAGVRFDYSKSSLDYGYGENQRRGESYGNRVAALLTVGIPLSVALRVAVPTS